MAGLVVNAAAAMESRKPLDPGEYHAVLTGHKVKPAASADKFASIVAEFTVHQDEGAPYAGKKAWRTLNSSPDALPFMIDAAIELGADPEEVVQTSVDFDDIFQQLHGTECWIVTSIREWQRNPNDAAQQQTNIDRILSQPSA
jgi:hypothetical protein